MACSRPWMSSGKKPSLRVVVLKGNGRHFQAGADLKWINRVRPKSPAENEAVSRARRSRPCSGSTVCRSRRWRWCRAAALAAAPASSPPATCVIAADNALFSITEVRWGLTAAIIIPQLCDSIGVRQVRRYALTGERFGAEEARRIGLVHEVVPLAELESAGARWSSSCWRMRPTRSPRPSGSRWKARSAAWPSTMPPIRGSVKMHSAKRQTDEASEGLASFAEKRAANWGAGRREVSQRGYPCRVCQNSLTRLHQSATRNRTCPPDHRRARTPIPGLRRI